MTRSTEKLARIFNNIATNAKIAFTCAPVSTSTLGLTGLFALAAGAMGSLPGVLAIVLPSILVLGLAGYADAIVNDDVKFYGTLREALGAKKTAAPPMNQAHLGLRQYPSPSSCADTQPLRTTSIF